MNVAVAENILFSHVIVSVNVEMLSNNNKTRSKKETKSIFTSFAFSMALFKTRYGCVLYMKMFPYGLRVGIRHRLDLPNRPK